MKNSQNNNIILGFTVQFYVFGFSLSNEQNKSGRLKKLVFPQYLNFTLQGKGNYYSKDFLLFFRSYIVFAGTSIQPGEPYKVAVTLFRNSNKKTYSFPFGPYDNLPATIQVQISRKGSVIISEIRECHFSSTELIIVTVSLHDCLKQYPPLNSDTIS